MYVLNIVSLINQIAWVEISSAYTVIRLVSPLFVTVSLTLCTPLSFILDMLVNHHSPSIGKWIWTGVLLFGFALLVIAQANWECGPRWTPIEGGLCKRWFNVNCEEESKSGTIEEIEMNETAELADARQYGRENYGAFEYREKHEEI